MTRFKAGEIVWIKQFQEGEQPLYLPGIVRSTLYKKDPLKYEISFIDQEIEKDQTVLNQNHLIRFMEVPFDEKKASKQQITSYQIALYSYKKFIQSQPSLPEQTEPVEKWNPSNLKKFLNVLQSDEEITPQQMRSAVLSIETFEVKKDHSLFYRKQNLTQKINYLINERHLQNSLKNALYRLNNRIIETVIKFVIDEGGIPLKLQ